MASVLIPQRQAETKKADNNAGFLRTAGLFTGSVFGNPGLGSAAGEAAASSTYGKNAEDRMMEAPSAESVDPQSETAASRRMAKIDQDPYTQIAQANMALERAPKDVQDAYRKPLEEAMEIARKSRDNAARAQSGGLA